MSKNANCTPFNSRFIHSLPVFVTGLIVLTVTLLHNTRGSVVVIFAMAITFPE